MLGTQAEPRPAGLPGSKQSTAIGRSWPEVALHADDAAPGVEVAGLIEAGRPAAGAAEIEQDQVRIEVGLDLRVHDLKPDIEVLHRVPDRPHAGTPDGEAEVAPRQSLPGHRPRATRSRVSCDDSA